MSSRAGWTYNGKHFAETITERGGLRYFIDGKPTSRAKFFAELAAAKTANQQAAQTPDRAMKITAKRILSNLPDIELNDGFIVEFGEGYETIAVAVRDGKIDVYSSIGTAIRIEPRAANLVWVSAIQPTER